MGRQLRPVYHHTQLPLQVVTETLMNYFFKLLLGTLTIFRAHRTPRTYFRRFMPEPLFVRAGPTLHPPRKTGCI